MRGVVLALTFALVVAISFPDEESILREIISIRAKNRVKADDGTLVQLDASSKDAEYPGCGLGVFWCTHLKAANVTSFNASRLTINKSFDNTYEEWHIDGLPTCVASGPHFHSCEVSHLLICAGDSDFGNGQEQVDAVKVALDNNGFHPQCPSCSRGRRMERSTSVCMTRKGDSCNYVCEQGYVMNGTRLCDESGSLIGGACIVPAVDTEAHELLTPSIVPSPSPSASPSWINFTETDVVHENWTAWNSRLDEEENSEYQRLLGEEICLYLLDLENYWHAIHLLPRKPLRAKLYDAARAGECAWFHEQEFSRNQEMKHLIPARGDKGPWPRILLPNVVHVTTPLGQFAINLDIEHSTGRDLYNAVAARMGLDANDFTVYSPGTKHPIDDSIALTKYGLQYSDILRVELAQRVFTPTNPPALTWHKGVSEDGDQGILAP